MTLSGPEEVGPNNSQSISKEVDALFDFVCQIEAPSLSKKISFAASLANVLAEIRNLEISPTSLKTIKVEADELFSRVARSVLMTKVIMDPPLAQETWQSFLENVEELLAARRKNINGTDGPSNADAAVKILVSQIVGASLGQLNVELKSALKNRINETDPKKLKPVPDGMEILERMIVSRIHFLVVFEAIINSGKSEVGGIQYMRGVNNLIDLIFFGINGEQQQLSGASLFGTFEKFLNSEIAQKSLQAYKRDLLEKVEELDINEPGLFSLSKEQGEFDLPLNFAGITESLPQQEPIGFMFERIEKIIAEYPEMALELSRVLRTVPKYLSGSDAFASQKVARHSEEILKGVALIWENSSPDTNCIAHTLEIFRSDGRAQYLSRTEKRIIQELSLSLSYQENNTDLRANIATICRYL